MKKLKREFKLASVNRPIAYLKACMSRAVEWGVIEQNPLSKVKLKTEDDNAVVRYLSDMEERRLRKAP
jgi:hypothetical protein